MNYEEITYQVLIPSRDIVEKDRRAIEVHQVSEAVHKLAHALVTKDLINVEKEYSCEQNAEIYTYYLRVVK